MEKGIVIRLKLAEKNNIPYTRDILCLINTSLVRKEPLNYFYQILCLPVCRLNLHCVKYWVAAYLLLT